jgi:hypothetical protein
MIKIYIILYEDVVGNNLIFIFIYLISINKINIIIRLIIVYVCLFLILNQEYLNKLIIYKIYKS